MLHALDFKKCLCGPVQSCNWWVCSMPFRAPQHTNLCTPAWGGCSVFQNQWVMPMAWGCNQAGSAHLGHLSIMLHISDPSCGVNDVVLEWLMCVSYVCGPF